MSKKTFSRGEVIFKEGAFPDNMYLIEAGQVGIFSDYKTDKTKLITILGEGELLGEMGLIEIRPRSATAVVLKDNTTLEEISEKDFNEYFKNHPEKILNILRQLSQRIRETNNKYNNACHTIYEMDETTHDLLDESEAYEQALRAAEIMWSEYNSLLL